MVVPPCCSICVITPNGEETFALDKTPVLVGRNLWANVNVAHASISREHAQFEFVEGRWRVRHLTSTNGLKVNAEPVAAGQSIPLNDGDTLRFSKHVTVRVSIPVDTEATQTDSSTESDGSLPPHCGLWLDERTGKIYINKLYQGQVVASDQRQLLSLFCGNPQEIIPYVEILQVTHPLARQIDKSTDMNLVHALVRRLRERLHAIDPAHEYILTVRNAGYKFVQRGD